MRQLFLENGTVTLKEACQPYLDDTMVLVQVHYSCISPGTEGAMIAATQERLFTHAHTKIKKVITALQTHGIEATRSLIREKYAGPIMSLGYAVSGVVIACGSRVKNIRVGDLVACAGAGYAHHADMVVVPENLVVPVRSAEHLRLASMTTLGAIALQGVRRAQLQLGEIVCVVGLGLLGQLTVQLAKNAGYTVIALDLIPARLELAAAHGADYIFNATMPEVEKLVLAKTGFYGADATIITASSKSDTLVQQAIRMTRRKGRVVVVGDVGLSLERSPLYEKEIDFLISCSYGPGRYDTAYEKEGVEYPYEYVRWTENRNMQTIVSMIEKGTLKIESLIAQTVPIEDAAHAYKSLNTKNALAMLLQYVDEHGKHVPERPKTVRMPTNTQPDIRIGMIGVGGFAKVKLIPLLLKMPGVKINATVDTNMANSLTVSKVYGAAKAFAHDERLFEEDLVDAVVIASPHKYHCAQAIRALDHDKAVFLEKPMVTDFAQFKQFKNVLDHYPTAPLCVNYNRSFSPYMQKIKKTIKNRATPLVIAYRVNAGFIPKDHWVQTEVGGGRIIGEACHMVDLFLYLTDSTPVSVTVETIKSTHDTVFSTDNFTAQISFADGSVCSLIYTALGSPDLPKERMELFFDSQTIIMDDYCSLLGYGLPTDFNETTNNPDKGHAAVINQFFTCLKTGRRAQPIPLSRLLYTAYTTLVIDQLASRRGGAQEIVL